MPVDHSSRIAEIREILRTGASAVTTDGNSVTFDLAALRRELRELMAEDTTLRHTKPRVSSINLGNA
jgi:hypothetical protein